MHIQNDIGLTVGYTSKKNLYSIVYPIYNSLLNTSCCIGWQYNLFQELCRHKHSHMSIPTHKQKASQRLHDGHQATTLMEWNIMHFHLHLLL